MITSYNSQWSGRVYYFFIYLLGKVFIMFYIPKWPAFEFKILHLCWKHSNKSFIGMIKEIKLLITFNMSYTLLNKMKSSSIISSLFTSRFRQPSVLNYGNLFQWSLQFSRKVILDFKHDYTRLMKKNKNSYLTSISSYFFFRTLNTPYSIMENHSPPWYWQ